MKACTVCGFTNPDGAVQCQACGTALVAPEISKARAGEATCAKHSDQPAIATCDRCGTFYCGACLQRAPDGRLYCEACRAVGGLLPWDRRAELGTMTAWWQTAVLMLKAPQVTLAGAQRDAPLTSSLLFTVIATIAGFVPSMVVYGFLFAGMFAVGLNQSQKMGDAGGPSPAIGVATGVFVFLFYAVAIFFGQIVMVLMFSGIEHVVLRLTGERELAGYTVTVRAHALGLSPYVLGLIPICGIMVFGLWSTVLRVMALSQLQKVSAGKAVISVLSPMLTACGCFGVTYAIVIAFVISTLGALKG